MPLIFCNTRTFLLWLIIIRIPHGYQLNFSPSLMNHTCNFSVPIHPCGLFHGFVSYQWSKYSRTAIIVPHWAIRYLPCRATDIPLRNLSYRPMVLLVGSVGDSSLELTDGWYSILSRFSYGSALHSLVVRGLIAQVTQLFLLFNYQILLSPAIFGRSYHLSWPFFRS